MSGTQSRARFTAKVLKTDPAKRLVFGHLIVCKVDGEDYRDHDGTRIPEDVMLDAALDWAKNVTTAKAMHTGDPVGTHPFLFPMTTEVAKAFGWDAPPKTGLMVGMQLDEETFERVESGELTCFSLGSEAATAVFED